jgi:dTDP-glucose 4,6-dehydratase
MSGARLDESTVLVTGAAGFIGSHLTRALVGRGSQVVALVSDVSELYPPRLEDLKGSIILERANLTDAFAVERVVERARPQFVFHLGAFTHVGRSFDRVAECMRTNIEGTHNILEALVKYPPHRLVYVSTSEVYGDVEIPFREDGPVHPVSPYGVSKYAAERLALIYNAAYSVPAVSIRPFNAYGPMQSPDRIIPETITRALRGLPVEITEGIQTREFNFVGDIVAGLLKAAEADDSVVSEVINVGCGEERSMKDVASRVLELLGNPVELRVGALPYRPREIWRMYCDNSKARHMLGWNTEVSFDEGLQKTIEWYRSEVAKPSSPFVL